jgi:hypothetical protein
LDDEEFTRAKSFKELAVPRRKPFACDICGKKFSMVMHLGRHKTAVHGTPSKTGRKKAARKGRKAGARRGGRPPAIATRFGLASLSLDDLAALIKAARQEAEARLKVYRDLLAR